MAIIQWYPGHMSKARRQVQENIKHVDFVTILVDARLPLSSQNPMLTKIVGDKPKLMILNKADLADSIRTTQWHSFFENQGIKTLAINSKDQSAVKKVTDAAKELMADKIAKLRERGIQKETLRTMIIGIPNAGKSTLMNRLAGKKIAVVGNKPGVTKGQQWLKSNKDLEILDTPGILWPKFEDEVVGDGAPAAVGCQPQQGQKGRVGDGGELAQQGGAARCHDKENIQKDQRCLLCPVHGTLLMN